MKRAKSLPTSRTPIQAQNVVRELCASIDATTRGDMTHAGSEIRRALTLSAKLLATGAIDSRGASLINGAAAKASLAIGARTPGTQDFGSVANKVADNRRRIVSPPGQSNSVEDQQFEALFELLMGGERKH